MLNRSIKPHIFTKLIVSLISLIISLVCVEIILRLTGYDPFKGLVNDKGGRHLVLRESDNKDAVFELSPNSNGYAWKTDVIINSFGFRDVEIQPEKGENFRIAVIGDSITFGFQVEQQETYPKLLESLFNENGWDPIEVINMGCPGYNIDQIISQFLAKGTVFHPDIVIYGFCLNDLMDADTSPNFKYIEKYIETKNELYHRLKIFQFINVKLYRLHLSNLARKNYSSAFEEAISSDLSRDQIDSETFNDMKAIQLLLKTLKSPPPFLADYASARKIQRLRFRLGQLKSLSEKYHFKPIIIIVPFFQFNNGDEYLYGSIHRIVKREGERTEIPVYDSLNEFQNNDFKKVKVDDYHPNEKGHRIIAKYILKILTKGNLIPNPK